ncbi:hypothetical protein GM708_02980 [Vibrio cholerae]|jgi:hypothetical protein|nr:hypothetical protein [Vibrio cholerae]
MSTECGAAPRSTRVRQAKGYAMEDHGGWIEVLLTDGSTVTDTDLLAFRDDLVAITDWRVKPVLIHMGALRGVTIEGRRRISRYEHPMPVAVLGAGPMDEVLANFILRSPTRARYFPARPEALDWLGIDRPTLPAGG